ncbi:MAG: flagellar M-ring protein FliF [Actinomycetota bacterium]|nr:flagellar M-ring protein FliF [Actinomycetota bacterium]
MPTALRGGAQRAARTFAAFTPGQKAVSVLAVVALLVGGLLFTRWAARPTYAPLYTSLSPTDASAIVEELQTAGVPYELPSATSILVPQDSVNSARVLLAGKSLPTEDSGSGWGILDKQGVTTSEFQQQVGFQRAMEGELKDTIQSIQGVKSARVQLAVPKKDVFADEDGKPTASVLVATMPGRDLTPQQVQAVVHLVAGAVPELDPDAVTVADADADAAGKVLSTSPDGTAGAAGDVRAQQTLDFEKRLSDEVRGMLEKVVGAGNVAVKVTADLDYNRTETKAQTHDITKGTPPLSSKKDTEEYQGTGGTPQGTVLGPDNIGGPTGTGGEDDSYRKTSETLNNAVNTTTSVSQSAPGSVRRLNTAVLLDAGAAGAIDPQQVEDLVTAALGIDARRGDTINVSRMAFDDTAATAAAEALKKQEAEERRAALLAGLRTAGLVLVVLLLLVAALIARRRRAKAGESRYAVELEALQQQIEELESRNVRALDAAPAPIAELEAAPSTADPEAERLSQVRGEIGELVESQPEEVAQLLRGWLADRRG